MQETYFKTAISLKNNGFKELTKSEEAIQEYLV